MGYKYYDLSNVAFEEWKKVFWFCLGKCDFFKTTHIFNYDKLEKDYLTCFECNNIQSEKIWHLTYRIIDHGNTYKKQNWNKLLEYSMAKSDFFYFCVPVKHKFEEFIKLTTKSISDLNIKKVLEDQNKEYYEIYGLINKECKDALLEVGIFDSLQSDPLEWRFKLISSHLGQNYFTATQNFIGLFLTGEDLKYFEDNGILLGEKIESNTRVYGNVTKELSQIISEMLTVSYNDHLLKDHPYYTTVTLCENNREMIFKYFEELVICLLDSELDELINNYKVDTSKWDLYKETSIYQAPMDFFSLRTHDLW